MLQKANTNVIGTKVSQWTRGSLFVGNIFFQRQTAFLKAYTAIFRKMLHKTFILIWAVMGYLHGKINAKEFALVQTEVWAYCQVFDAFNGVSFIPAGGSWGLTHLFVRIKHMLYSIT